MRSDDLHREFITPIRLNSGEVLYRDFNYVYPPLAPYVNSRILRLADPIHYFTVLRITAAGLFVLNIIFTLILTRQMGIAPLFGPVLAGMAAWAGPYTFNPPAFSELYAEVFALFGVICAIRAVQGNRRGWFGAGAALAASLLSKPEGVFTAGLAGLGAYVYKTISERRFLSWELLTAAGGFVVLSVPFTACLLIRGLSPSDIAEGILQKRFRDSISTGFIDQFNYFNGTSHVIAIATGVLFVAVVLFIARLYHSSPSRVFALTVAGCLLIGVLIICGVVPAGRFGNYAELGAFFGGICGWWWFRQAPDNRVSKAFLIFWLAALGGWLRPLFHIGAIVIPYRVGGGMPMAGIFWFVMLPAIISGIYPAFNSDRQSRCFLLVFNSLCILLFAAAGLRSNFENYGKHRREIFNTPYGSFCGIADEQANIEAAKAISWIKSNLKDNYRVVALEALNIELVLGELPCIPLSQLNYQLYPGDQEKIIKILDDNQNIQFVIVPVRNGGYHFGIQGYKIADYLESNWQRVKDFSVPVQLTDLSRMSPERKYDAGLVYGLLIYGRKG